MGILSDAGRLMSGDFSVFDRDDDGRTIDDIAGVAGGAVNATYDALAHGDGGFGGGIRRAMSHGGDAYSEGAAATNRFVDNTASAVSSWWDSL